MFFCQKHRRETMDSALSALYLVITIAALIGVTLWAFGIIGARGKHGTTLHTSPLPMEPGAVQGNNTSTSAPLNEDTPDLILSCHSCQAPLRVGDYFCSQCGHQCRKKHFQVDAPTQSAIKLPISYYCARCSTVLLPQDKFCGVCGNKTQSDTEITYHT